MFLSHDQLEIVTGVLTLTGGGWIAYAKLKQSSLDEKIEENKKMLQIQWQKIDELKSKAENCITRDRHDQSIRDIYSAIERSVEVATKPLIDALNRLSDKVDKLMQK